jgi:phospholipase C
MPPGRDPLKHVVVLMMENRSFDHRLGSLKGGESGDRQVYRLRSVHQSRYEQESGEATGSG